MKQDEIIDMAKQAGFRYTGNFSVDKGESLSCFQADLEAFAKLVADVATAKEREACAKESENSDHVVLGRGYYDQLGDADATVRNIAAAIRARVEPTSRGEAT